MYAIVNISGKQYKAEKGSKLCVPKQHLDEGKKLVFEDVLMVHDGKSSKFGNPNVAGAKVTATILDHGRERKILVYKKKDAKGIKEKMGTGSGILILKYKTSRCRKQKTHQNKIKKQKRSKSYGT